MKKIKKLIAILFLSYEAFMLENETPFLACCRNMCWKNDNDMLNSRMKMLAAEDIFKKIIKEKLSGKDFYILYV